MLPIQEAALGPEHCDVAATLDSLAQAVAYMMSHGVRLLQAAVPEWDTVPKVSKAQHAYLKRSRAIQQLYK